MAVAYEVDCHTTDPTGNENMKMITRDTASDLSTSKTHTLVLVFEVSIKLVNSLNLALLVLLSPSVVRLHSVKKEMFSVLETFSDELEAFVDLVLLLL